MIFARQLRRPTQHRYETRIFTTGTEIRIDFRYKHSRVKQYLKDGHALRIETVINRPDDLDVQTGRPAALPELIDKARQVNQRLLMIEQAGQSCAIGSALFERIHQPYHPGGPKNRSLALRGRTSDSPGRRPVHRPRCRHRLFEQKPAPTRRRPARPALHPEQDELRPPPSPLARTHPTHPPQKHLHPHPRRDPRRRLLHQTPQPAPQTPLDADKPPAKTEIRQALRTLENAVADYIQTARLAPAK